MDFQIYEADVASNTWRISIAMTWVAAHPDLRGQLNELSLWGGHDKVLTDHLGRTTHSWEFREEKVPEAVRVLLQKGARPVTKSLD